ncbi:hypothetical protein ACFQ0B_17260 [Nonomuraea thailandensis]
MPQQQRLAVAAQPVQVEDLFRRGVVIDERDDMPGQLEAIREEVERTVRSHYGLGRVFFEDRHSQSCNGANRMRFSNEDENREGMT